MDRVMYGTTPEPAAVTVNNNAITVAIDSAKVTWVVDRFTVADSVGGLGAAFFLSKAAAVASQVQVWLDNTHQEPPTLLTAGMFTVSQARDKITLNGFTIGAGEVLVIRYLGYVAAAGAGADAGGPPNYLDGLVQKSIVENATDHKIELDGDVADPGANKVYGTDGAGIKGWQDAGGGGTVGVSANDTTPGYLQQKLVGDANWLATEEVNDGGDEDLRVKHVGPHAPTAVQTIGAAAEGNETAEGSSFVVGTGGNGMDLWVLSRIGYFHDGGRKLYMYVRKLTVDETGHVRGISAETRVEVDACVVETV